MSEIAREIAHKHTTRCTGDTGYSQGGDGTRYHSKRCDELTAEIEAALSASLSKEKELREALEYYALEDRYDYDVDCCPERNNPGSKIAEVDLLSDDRGRRARAAMER